MAYDQHENQNSEWASTCLTCARWALPIAFTHSVASLARIRRFEAGVVGRKLAVCVSGGVVLLALPLHLPAYRTAQAHCHKAREKCRCRSQRTRSRAVFPKPHACDASCRKQQLFAVAATNCLSDAMRSNMNRTMPSSWPRFAAAAPQYKTRSTRPQILQAVFR